MGKIMNGDKNYGIGTDDGDITLHDVVKDEGSWLTGYSASSLEGALGYLESQSGGTDTNVTQTATDSASSNTHYELLFSNTADNTTRTEGARKTQYLTYNPYSNTLNMENTGSYKASIEYNRMYFEDKQNQNKYVQIGFNGGDYANMSLTDTVGTLVATSIDIELNGDGIYSTWDGTHNSLRAAIEAAGQSGGGSTVTITPSLSSGTKVADYSIDGVSGSLYAPSGGGGSGSDGSLVIANNDMRPSSGYWGGGASGSTAYLSTTVNWVENIGGTLTLDNGYLTEVDSASVQDGHFGVGKYGGVGTILIADDNGDGDVELDNGGNGWTGYGSTSLKESLGHLFTNVSGVTDILVLNSSGYPSMVDSTSNEIADCHLFIGDSSNGGDGRIILADNNGSGDIGLDGSASWTGYGSTSLRESLGEIYTYALRESAFENISYNGYTGITAIEKMAEDLSNN